MSGMELVKKVFFDIMHMFAECGAKVMIAGRGIPHLVWDEMM